MLFSWLPQVRSKEEMDEVHKDLKDIGVDGMRTEVGGQGGRQCTMWALMEGCRLHAVGVCFRSLEEAQVYMNPGAVWGSPVLAVSQVVQERRVGCPQMCTWELGATVGLWGSL